MLILHPSGLLTPYKRHISIHNSQRRSDSVTYLEDEALIGSPKEFFKLLFCPLLCIQQGQHQQIHTPHDFFIPVVFSPRLTETMVVDDDTRTRFESWD